MVLGVLWHQMTGAVQGGDPGIVCGGGGTALCCVSCGVCCTTHAAMMCSILLNHFKLIPLLTKKNISTFPAMIVVNGFA